VRHGNRWVQARIAAIESRLDIHSLQATDAHELNVNEIGHVVIETQQPIALDPYDQVQTSGAFILADAATNHTVAAGMVQ